jgi:hypothetical protein
MNDLLGWASIFSPINETLLKQLWAMLDFSRYDIEKAVKGMSRWRFQNIDGCSLGNKRRTGHAVQQ